MYFLVRWKISVTKSVSDNVKYGHHLPYCSLVMALNNVHKRVLEEHYDATVKLSFDLFDSNFHSSFYPARHLCGCLCQI